MLLDALTVRFDADGAVLAEAVAAVRDQPRALQEVVRKQRLEHVELEVAAGAAEVHGHTSLSRTTRAHSMVIASD